MTNEQLLGGWLMFAAGFVAAAVLLLVGGSIAYTREGRGGGARRGGRRSGCVADGACRRGEGSPRRIYREEVVEQFLAGLITIDDMRDFYHGKGIR